MNEDKILVKYIYYINKFSKIFVFIIFYWNEIDLTKYYYTYIL